jgi:hypothetical protein
MMLDNQTLFEGLKKLAEQNKPSPFEGWVRKAEQWAHEVLTKAGHRANQLTGVGDLRHIARTAEEDSDKDFAARILALIAEVRLAIRDGDAARAAMAGVRLGEAIALHDTKALHEPIWTTGYKQRSTLAAVREKTNTDRHTTQERKWKDWNKAAAPIWQRHPDWSQNDVAKIDQPPLSGPVGMLV